MRRFPLTALLVGALLISGCAALRPPVVPMPVDKHAAACQADTLLVWLPGAYSTTDEFVREGFVAALRDRRIAADTWLADAHLGYFRDRSVFDRLQADVFAPARAAGYRRIWLAGISLGGFGALLHEEMHPGQAAGLVVIAPYLGEPALLGEIAAAGVARWQPPRPLPARVQEAAAVRLWTQLQQTSAAGVAAQPSVWLGYGTEDRLAAGHRLLAGALPPERVATTPGGHDWPEWRRLWLQLLDRLPLPRCDG